MISKKIFKKKSLKKIMLKVSSLHGEFGPYPRKYLMLATERYQFT